MIVKAIRILLAAALLLAAPAAAELGKPEGAIAMHGSPALPPGASHWPYANPGAPKGGQLNLAYLGAFDSLNPYNVKALSTAQGLIGNVYQPLMMRSLDEPFTLYGLVAQSIETSPTRDKVVFHLDPRAHFSDGSPITSADVLFTFNLLKAKGRPQTRAAYSLVKGADASDDHTVRFDLTGADDRELPLTLALMPVLPKAQTDAAHFEDQTLAPPLASGPYVVAEVIPGERLVLKRDPNYWGRDLPIARGLYNFDTIRIDYFRDASAMFEAFKAGLVDYRVEDNVRRWQSEYDFPALKDGRVAKASIPDGLPKGVSGFAFNTRRKPFDDPRVREALASMFDFEWINANLYAGAYKRSEGFFDESPLSSIGHPASEQERALLAPFPGAVREDVMEGRWRAPVSDGSGRDREVARRAIDELQQAGFALKDGRMVDAQGQPLDFEIDVKTREEERLALAYARNLARIGVTANVRLLDEVQFQRRRTRFDFDVIPGTWTASPSPGNEQRGRWSSAAANAEGAYNLAGVHSPAVDAMIAAILAAGSDEDFVAAIRALDRLLISGFYITPFFYAPEQWIAYSTKLGHPDKAPLFGVDLFRLVEAREVTAPPPATFDALLREAALRAPAAVMAPQRVDFAALDSLADHYAARLREALARLADGALLIVAPTAQSVAAMIGALRAGLALSVAPADIHGRELDSAILAADASIVAGPARYAALATGDLMCRVAVDQERVSLVATHGGEISGVLALDGARESYATFEPRSARVKVGFVASANGQAPRFDEVDLIVAAQAIMRAARIGPGEVILTTVSPASPAGLTAGPLTALAAGARLIFHAPFDSRAFLAALDAAAPVHLVLPQALVSSFRAAGVLGGGRVSSLIISCADEPETPTWGDALGGFPVVTVGVGALGGMRVDQASPNGLPNPGDET